MSMVKNEDFKIIEGADKLTDINSIQRLLNITLFCVWSLHYHNPRSNPAMTDLI